jgi:hypothetical protein
MSSGNKNVITKNYIDRTLGVWTNVINNNNNNNNNLLPETQANSLHDDVSEA